MTDRVHTLTVVLEQNVRVDDVEALKAAINQLRGVLSVTGHVADIESHMAEQRAVGRLTEQLLSLLKPKTE